jgi:tRNA(Ile)-lysidine synthase
MARGGSGLNGLSGIPVKRDSFIRPFLCITRSEVEQLVEKYGTGNITDETNLGDDYSRNKIRHHVIPILKRINPNAELSVGKVCARIEKAQEYIEKVAAEKLYNADKNHGNPEAPHWVEYKTPNFLAEDEIIQEEMICQLLGKINFLNEQFIELLKNYINTPFHDDGAEFFFGELQLSDKQSIVVTSKYITIKNREEEKVTGLEEGKVTFGQFKYSFDIKQINQEQFQSECKSKEHLKWYADASKLDVSKCILRSKSEGDKFKPACKTGGKVSKFLKWAPIAEKDSIPLIEYEGKIVWVYGEGFTDGFTPDQDTDKVYSIY